jgi:DNA-directed RNA polymerase alpha subunit
MSFEFCPKCGTRIGGAAACRHCGRMPTRAWPYRWAPPREKREKQTKQFRTKQDEISFRKRKPATKEAIAMREILSEPIERLRLSRRAENALLRHTSIRYVWQLVQLTDYDLLHTPSLGRRSLNNIKEVLIVRGLHLGMEIMSPTDLEQMTKADDAA